MAKHLFAEVFNTRTMCHCRTSQSDSWTLVTCLTRADATKVVVAGAVATASAGGAGAGGAEAGGDNTRTSSDEVGEGGGER